MSQHRAQIVEPHFIFIEFRYEVVMKFDNCTNVLCEKYST